MKHILPDEDESGDEAKYNVGDIVCAVWLPNGQFYDANVLQNRRKCQSFVIANVNISALAVSC